MRKFLFFVLFSSFLRVNAQINFPMPGADWHYQVENYSFFGPSTYTNVEVKYTQDTVFMGKTAKVLDNLIYYNYCSPSSGSSFFYTSNDSVFFYNSETLNQWQLLYSFGTPIGQSWQFYLQNSSNGIDTVIVTVDSVKFSPINSISLKTLFVTYTEKNPSIPPYHSIIYDRMGDLTYLFNFVPIMFGICDGGQKFEGILCYSDSSFSLYQPDTLKPCNYSYVGIPSFSASEAIQIYPNPTAGSFVIDVNRIGKVILDLYDINGNHVLNATISNTSNINVSYLDKGVYTAVFTTLDRVISKKLVLTW